MSQDLSVSSVSAGGNTNPPARIRSRSWFFTWNNPAEDFQGSFVSLSTRLKSLGAEAFAYQLEQGDSGTPHLQGFVRFKLQKDFSVLKREFPKPHWEKCISDQASIDYCTKLTGRIEGPWFEGCRPTKKEVRPFEELYPWQQEVCRIIAGPVDTRRVLWIWEPTGGVGKTELARYLVRKHGALFLSGKSADVKCGVASWLEKGKDLPVAVFNFVRSQESYISYQAIEEVKDGIFFSSKYESGMVDIDPPHLICLANFPPDMTKLSIDRWDIRQINDNKEFY